MATSLKKMNRALFEASIHLMEAGKHLSNVDEFGDEARQLLMMADELASIIKEEPEKVSEDKMKSILDEIMAHGDTN